jgi:hypothetical protein
MGDNMNSYELSRAWFDFAFEHPEKISPNHAAIYFFAIEHCNRLGWKKKFGFPTQMAMDAIGIKKHQTYIKYFNDLVEWGFFELVQKSLNQYSANIICIKSAMPKNGKALDKAIITHAAKQTEPNGQSNGQSTGQSNGSINKPITINNIIDTSLENCIKLFLEKTAYNWTEQYAKKEAEKFYNFYSAKGWMVGKNKMKSVGHAVNGWIARNDKPETIEPKKDKPIFY